MPNSEISFGDQVTTSALRAPPSIPPDATAWVREAAKGWAEASQEFSGEFETFTGKGISEYLDLCDYTANSNNWSGKKKKEKLLKAATRVLPEIRGAVKRIADKSQG